MHIPVMDQPHIITWLRISSKVRDGIAPLKRFQREVVLLQIGSDKRESLMFGRAPHGNVIKDRVRAVDADNGMALVETMDDDAPADASVAASDCDFHGG